MRDLLSSNAQLQIIRSRLNFVGLPQFAPNCLPPWRVFHKVLENENSVGDGDEDDSDSEDDLHGLVIALHVCGTELPVVTRDMGQ